MKATIYEIKNSMDGFNNRLYLDEKRISEPEDRERKCPTGQTHKNRKYRKEQKKQKVCVKKIQHICN